VINRSESRDIIIKVLYQKYIFDNSSVMYDLEELKKELIEVSNQFIDENINGIIEKQIEIEEIANRNLKDWSIDRLSKVDKAILSLAIYELMYTDTPGAVAINEAVELSKKYSDDKVVKMINATLDSIYHNEDINE